VFDRWLATYRWGWCALAGLLLALSFAPFSCAPCAWIALVPAWWVITRSEQVRSHPLRYGYLIGLICFGATFWWISDVTFLGIVFLIPYLALYPAVWFLLVVRFLRPLAARTIFPALVQAVGAAALWVTLEWWRGWFLTGFNWNELGDSQAPSVAFRQLAAFGGVHLISFVLVVVNILWADGLLAMIETARRHRVVRPSLPFATALFLVAIAFALGCHHLQRHRGETELATLSFAAIQPDIAQIVGGESDEKMQAALDTQVRLSLTAIADHPQLLIWPEVTIDQGVFNDRPMNEAVQSVCERNDGYFLLGSQDFDVRAHKIYNAAYLFSPGGDHYDEYRKVYLVVVGEYLPFGNIFPSIRRWLQIGMDFSRGPGPRKFTLDQQHLSFSPLICFEDTQADVVDRAARLHPDFFITISDDAWYTGWCAQWGIRQHLQEAIFRCIEHDRPMIRCSNNGITCVVDPSGAITDRYRDPAGKDIDVPGIFAGTLHVFPAHRTLYESWGEWIVLLSGAISAMLSIPFFRGWRGGTDFRFSSRPRVP
jgi:apolipoprotein N-acyltransferase